MSSFQVAHINEQGVNVVVVFLQSSIGSKPAGEIAQVAAQLQTCAISAGLAGNIALVWDRGFWAPRNQHAFFSSAGGSFAALQTRINRTLDCG